MGRRPRKRRRRHKGVAAGQGPDRFSHLTEDLLRSILNCLPARTAVRMAAVSRHFRNEVPRLIQRVDSLTIHEPHFPDPLRVGALIRRLTIAPHRVIPPSSFRPIIDQAAQHGVSELSFRLARRTRLPKNILTVKSLVVLALDTCALPPWSDVSCPHLRTLKLRRVAIHQENINSILASASCLETLEMEFCTGHGKARGCTVESSSVRNLVFRPTLKQEATVIRAPGLRVLTLYTRNRAKSLELAPAPEIRKVYLHMSKSKSMEKSMEPFKVRPFLDAAVKLECLTLRAHAAKVLSYEYEKVPKLTVMFQDLRSLSVSLNLASEQEPVLLLKLLERCPNLQNFVLSAAEPRAAEPRDSETGNDSDLPRFTDHKAMLASLSCLTTSLVQFKFLGFKPQEYQEELVVYLLTAAKQLKKVGVEFDQRELAAVKRILSVRGATTERTSTKYKKNCYMELEYS